VVAGARQSEATAKSVVSERHADQLRGGYISGKLIRHKGTPTQSAGMHYDVRKNSGRNLDRGADR